MSLTTTQSFLFALITILLALIPGLVRFNKIDKSYRPFIYFLAVGTVSEIVSFILIDVKGSNAVVSNIYILIELFLIVWQFNLWGFFNFPKKSFYLILLLAAIWIAENIVAGRLSIYSPYFRVLDYFVITLMSVNIINYIITHNYKNIFRQPQFLICLAFVLFFIYKMLYEWAYQISTIKRYELFSQQVSNAFSFVNALANLVFARAVLLFPGREKYKLK